MSNLPKWISVEERLPGEDEGCILVYTEYEHTNGNRYFDIIKAAYFSDVNKAVAEECYIFDAEETNGINSGFFGIEDGDYAIDYAYLLTGVQYWMPAFGLCDTTTSGQ